MLDEQSTVPFQPFNWQVQDKERPQDVVVPTTACP